MNENKQAQWAAYAVAILFALRLPTFFIPGMRDATALTAPLLGVLNAMLGIAPHLLLFVVVAVLPAPQWAKAAGYGWLVIDMATDIMALDGVAQLTAFSLKYGGHLSAALWIATSAWRAGGAMRIVGLLLALDLASYSFISSFAPVWPLLPSIVLLPLWFVLVGHCLGRLDVGTNGAHLDEAHQVKGIDRPI